MLKRYLRNVDSRILRDIYSDKTGYFLAYIFGESKGEFLLEIDPEQVEQISVTQHSKMDFVDVWSSFSIEEQKRQEDFSIPYFEVEIDIEKDGKMEAIGTIDLVPNDPPPYLNYLQIPFLHKKTPVLRILMQSLKSILPCVLPSLR